MTRVLLTDMLSYQLRAGDKVVSQEYDAAKNTVMFSILRKTGEAKPVKVPEPEWIEVGSATSITNKRARLTAPDGSCVLEYNPAPLGSSRTDERTLLLGSVHARSAELRGWKIEVRR